MRAAHKTASVTVFAAITAASVLIALALPSAAPAEPRPQVQFFHAASNGYEVFAEAERGKLRLAVADGEGEAIYNVEARMSARRIKARIGNLGRIDVEFRPSGKARTIVPPDRCEGRAQTVREGLFVGTVRFRGEGGYAALETHRVRGSMATPRRWRCRPTRGGSDGTLESPPLGVPVIGGHTADDRVSFAAIGESEGFASMRSFIAAMLECRGTMRIERVVSAEGPASTFSAVAGLGAATVQPPAPFSGAASFTRNADGSATWAGSLGVALPGAGRISLTEPGFQIELEKPKTRSRFRDLAGLSPRGLSGRC